MATDRIDGFAPLRNYLATGDGRTVALIAADGAVDWLAVPALDHPPTFSALLDPDHGGRLHLAPTGEYTAQRRYVSDSNVVETTFTTGTGAVRVTDSLNSGLAGRLPWTEFARRVEGVHGSVDMAWRVGAGRALGEHEPWAYDDRGTPSLGCGPVRLALVLDGVGAASLLAREWHGAFSTSAGSCGLLAVVGTCDEPLHVPASADVQHRLDLSIAAWQRWSDAFRWDGPWPDEVRRSALALKLLLYSPTGAIAAAATTSVPEAIGGCKNWDYRYTWVRDTAYTIDAFIRCEMHEEVHAAIAWLLNTLRRHAPGLRPFHTLHGDAPAGRRDCNAPGYRNSPPVVSGNDAAGQLQLGPYGDVFQAVYLATRNGHTLDPGTRDLLTMLADDVAQRWTDPDSGMWELHDLRHYTVSKMSCWQALDRAARLSDSGELPADHGSRWRAAAADVRSWTEDHCWSAERSAYVLHPGTDELDAGVLLGARFGFDRGERMRSTTDAVLDALARGPAVYRFTGADTEEGAFVACTFWAVEALALTGRGDEAERLMNSMLSLTGPPDLLAEMIDPSDGSYLGNLPQALSHLALINAAAAVADGV